jgi:gamma-tubulin complex component 5
MRAICRSNLPRALGASTTSSHFLPPKRKWPPRSCRDCVLHYGFGPCPRTSLFLPFAGLRATRTRLITEDSCEINITRNNHHQESGMAAAARVGELAEGLVKSITAMGNDQAHFKALHERALKGLKDHSHPRTNQFAVRDRCAGLVEKFAVRNREDLADALQNRLDELPTQSKWLPETLSLLLQLSDRPLENTRIEDLGTLSGLDPLTSTEPTWEEILAEDPLDEDGIWDDVERGYHSSGDEAALDDEDDSEHTTSTQATSVDVQDLVSLAKLYLIRPDASLLDRIRESKGHLDEPISNGHAKVVSELLLIRETLHMLQGLPGPLFWSAVDGGISLDLNYAISTASSALVKDAVDSCAAIGTKLNHLRLWCKNKQKTPHIQSMQEAVEGVVRAFNQEAGKLAEKYARPIVNTVVSIIIVRTEIEQITQPLVYLSAVIRADELSPATSKLGFGLLNLLYEEACTTHISGDHLTFTALGKVFFAGLKTYLKPVRDWTETGILPTQDTDTFFVQDAHPNCDLGVIWHERWQLRPSLPRFMLGLHDTAFALGKAKAFTGLLDPSAEQIQDTEQKRHEGPAELESILTQLENNPLLPFPQVIDELVQSSIGFHSMNPAQSLSKMMLAQQGFKDVLHAIEYVFFAKDGVLFQTFAETLFRRITRGGSSWKGDRFLLTELAQMTLGTAPGVDDSSLAITLHQDEAGQLSVTNKLATMQLRYSLSWPIQNIVCSSELQTHAKIFALLLQVYYCKQLLCTQLFALRTFDRTSHEAPAEISTSLRLRVHLLWFVDVLNNHITTSATGLHQSMCTEMEQADGIDAMVQIWITYQRRLQTVLLLAPNLAPIRNAITEIFESCEQFAGIWNSALPASSSSAGLSSSEMAQNPTPQQPRSDASTLLMQFEKSLSFISAGLRGVSRAGGESALEALAERLDWRGG